MPGIPKIQKDNIFGNSITKESIQIQSLFKFWGIQMLIYSKALISRVHFSQFFDSSKNDDLELKRRKNKVLFQAPKVYVSMH